MVLGFGFGAQAPCELLRSNRVKGAYELPLLRGFWADSLTECCLWDRAVLLPVPRARLW